MCGKWLTFLRNSPYDYMQARTLEVDWGGTFRYIMDLNSAVFVGGSGGMLPNFFVKNTL